MLYKHILISIFLALIFISFNYHVYAAAGRYVNGVVTDTNKIPLSGASVAISCLGNIINTITNPNGEFSVQFEKLSHCLKGSVVTVTAEKEGVAKTITKKMEDTSVVINVELQYVQPTPPPVSVPEYSTATATATVVMATASYLIAKKSQKRTDSY